MKYGTSSALKVLYHSDAYPSGPDCLFDFSLDIALFASSVIMDVNFRFVWSG